MTIYLPYRLSLQRPAVLRKAGGDPNSAETLDYVPGATFRGIVASLVALDSELLQRLVLDPDIRYLDGFLEIDGQRSNPSPASWRYERTNRHSRAYDLAVANPPEDLRTKSERNFVANDASESAIEYLVLDKPKRTGRMHNQRDPEKGRAWKDASGESYGALFGYEALDAGQTFQGLIAMEDESLVDELRTLLPDASSVSSASHEATDPAVINLGRSKLAAYGGHAQLQWLPTLDLEPSPVFQRTGDLTTGDPLQIVFLSDCLCRDATTGKVDSSALARAIETQLPVRVDRRWVTSASTGGFNRRWGMSLPSLVAAGGGSVLACTATSPINADQLRALEHRGIGLRRRDGFGRFACVTPPSEARVRVKAAEEEPQQQPEGAAPALILDLQARRIRQRIDERITTDAIRIVDSVTEIPTTSLLGRLRTVFRQGGRAQLVELLHSNRLRVPARNQLHRGQMRVGGRNQNLAMGLKTLAKAEPSVLEAELGLKAIVAQAKLAPETPTLEQPALDDIADRLVSETLDRMHLAARQRRRGSTGESELIEATTSGGAQ